MFALSRSTEYAVMALARLAEARSQAPPDGAAEPGCPGEPISARALAASEGCPAPVVSGVLKRLHQAGLVGSKRGARGGYYLDRPPERIDLLAVIAAVEGPEPVRLTPCCEQDEPDRRDATPQTGEKPAPSEESCPIMCHCPITGAVRGLNHRMQAFLGQLTLADLMA